MPSVNAQATGIKVYQRNSDNTGWQMNADLSTTCYTNINAGIRGQLLRFTFNDTLTNGENYTLSFNVSTQTNLDYAWFRWGNEFGSGGILQSGRFLSQQPTSGQTTATSSIPMTNYTLYSKSSKLVFDVSPTTTGTFSLDIPTYLLSYFQLCLDGYSIQRGTSQSTGDSQAIINNNNQNTQTIINNNNNNTNNIINNQNENTDKEIESQKVCKTININKNSIVSSGYLNSNGQIISTDSYGITDYISVYNDSVITVTKYLSSSNSNTCFYDSSKTLLSCISNLNQPIGNVTIPSGARYLRFSIYKPTDIPNFTVKSCINGNQALSDDINDLNNTLNDTTIEGSSIGGKFAEIDTISDTPITDLLTMPLVLLNKLYDGISGSCTAYILPFGLLGGNESVTLPCFDGERYLGSAWSIIDGLVCLFMLYNIGMMIINFFENVTSLQDTFDSMYVPKHTYHPKHGGGN